MARILAAGLSRISMLMLGLGMMFIGLPGSAPGQEKPGSGMASMPGMNASTTGRACDDTSHMGAMTVVMGESMAAMATHLCMTPLRPMQPGDEEKAKALVVQVKEVLEKYKDYKKALADGYTIANPNVEMPQYHFMNAANAKLADTQFDAARPTALLYYHTANQRYRLEGVMYTDDVDATEDQLNQRIPLSIARWHQHINFCAAPANKVSEYHGATPKFGMFGSIHTAEACKAEGGTFFPIIFNWMVHVFPYENDLKDVFSMNDDESHAH
jgi:hypothetical protein